MSLFPVRVSPNGAQFNFLSKKWAAFALSIALLILTIVLLFIRGLNFGIDFTGGMRIDARFSERVDIAQVRSALKDANVGEVSLQTFGDDNNILIRVGQKPDSAKTATVVEARIKSVLANKFGDDIDYRQVEYVGPKVGGELIKSGALSLILAFLAIMLYIWFRFEWQYGVGAIVALIHDSLLTLGFFSLTQLEFNLSSIAAILTIIGYSINDSVVIFDRIRENLRKFKAMPLVDLLNVSINNNLIRTALTSATTLAALLALVLMGGEVIKSFSLAALFGVVVGTYSSIYIAAPLLFYMNLRPLSNTPIDK